MIDRRLLAASPKTWYARQCGACVRASSRGQVPISSHIRSYYFRMEHSVQAALRQEGAVCK